MNTYLIVILAVLALASVIFITSYVKAPPSVAYILSGFCKNPRILVGKGGFKVPVLERLDKLFLGQVTVDVKTPIAVPTHDFIDVKVDAVCKIQVDHANKDQVQLAAKNFLNMESQRIAEEVKDSLEGNMREVIGAINLQDLVTDRDKFSDQIQEKAAKDMAKLGLVVISCNIQNITDEKELIKGLGADNTEAIRKNAAITRATAQKEVTIAQAQAEKEANDAKIESETAIAERNNELEIRKADLKKASDIKKAEADAAYSIQEQEQQKIINDKTVEAQIILTKKQQILSEEQVRVKENQLRSQVNAQADADKYKMATNADAAKYQTTVNAEAELEKNKREAEAQTYIAEQKAKAAKAIADANLYTAQQEAAGIEAKGLATAKATAANLKAEAEGILAKGEAEAKAMEKKADAYKKSDFAKFEMITKMAEKVLPSMAENIAKPMGNIDNVNIYGTTGTEVSGMSENVPVIMQKTMDTLSQATGVDMKDILKSQTIQAKTDKKVTVDGAETVVPTV